MSLYPKVEVIPPHAPLPQTESDKERGAKVTTGLIEVLHTVNDGPN